MSDLPWSALPPKRRRALARQFLQQAVLVTLLAMLVAVLVENSGSWRFNHLVHDQLLKTQPQQRDPSLLIVAIDNASLEQLGRWPWPRSRHIELLTQLHNAGVRAVLMDLVFAEPSDSDTDLATALRAGTPVFLPGARSPSPPYALLPPMPPLAQAAAGVGHIEFTADTDGVIRRLALLDRGPPVWPQITWTLFQALYPVSTELRQQAEAGPVMVPFQGSPGAFPTISYHHVLAGRVPDSLLKDRVVLVGATAAGLGDRYPVPTSGQYGSMPGVEIQAHLLNALLAGQLVTEVPPPLTRWLSALPALLFMTALWLSGWRAVHLWALLTALLTLATSAALLRAGLWWPPAAALLGLVAAYLLWWWRSQTAVLNWFDQELLTLKKEPSVLPPSSPAQETYPRSLVDRIMHLEHGIHELRASRRFIGNMLDSLPLETFLVDPSGRVLAVSRRAHQWSHCPHTSDHWTLRERLLTQMPETRVPDFLDLSHGPAQIASWDGEEFIDRRGRTVRLEVSPLHSHMPPSASTLWLVCVVDLSAERQAAQQRAHMLRFLSHDLKAPQASMLALLDLQGSSNPLPAPTLYQRLRQQLHHTLQLVDGFTQYAKAEYTPPALSPVLLANLVLDAVDRVWPQARQKHIALHCDELDDNLAVQADRALVARALVNLLDNAIKYSPAHTAVQVRLVRRGHWAECEVEDQGPGVASSDQAKLFELYQRGIGALGTEGAGLGLAFVHTVMAKHGGGVHCQNSASGGAVFTLRFPLENGRPE